MAVWSHSDLSTPTATTAATNTPLSPTTTRSTIITTTIHPHLVDTTSSSTSWSAVAAPIPSPHQRASAFGVERAQAHLHPSSSSLNNHLPRDTITTTSPPPPAPPPTHRRSQRPPSLALPPPSTTLHDPVTPTARTADAATMLPDASGSQQLSAALCDLAMTSTTSTLEPPATARLNALQSPCFYHQRFDDAVDIARVLEEINGDEFMSHSRLMQTATGVREVSKQLQRRPIKRAVRSVMIVTKARDNTLVTLTRDLAAWLLKTPRYGSDLGVNVYVDAKLRNSKRFNAAGLIDEQPRLVHMLKYWTPDMCWSQPEKFDLVLTLGGDGTVLFTSWLFQRIVPPTLSFSLGSLGFLTNFEYDRFKEHLNRIMGDDGMRVNLRMRFSCTVYRHLSAGTDPVEAEQFEVLNELVIDRGPSSYISNLELYGDDELLTIVQADGCIFSTPTGSTAYSLSAGGSLVHPDIPAILLTPICPHSLSFRPMVLSDTLLLRIAVPRNSRATAFCSFDGKGRVELRQGDYVTIAASPYPFPTVVRTGAEWFDSVSRTLRWNMRGATQKGWDGAEEKGEDEVDWDIDTDSAYYASEENSSASSPLRRQMSLLSM